MIVGAHLSTAGITSGYRQNQHKGSMWYASWDAATGLNNRCFADKTDETSPEMAGVGGIRKRHRRIRQVSANTCVHLHALAGR